MSARADPHAVFPHDHLLMFVVRTDGEPGLYVAEGVTAQQASQLLTEMGKAVLTDPRFHVKRDGETT